MFFCKISSTLHRVCQWANRKKKHPPENSLLPNWCFQNEYIPITCSLLIYKQGLDSQRPQRIFKWARRGKEVLKYTEQAIIHVGKKMWLKYCQHFSLRHFDFILMMFHLLFKTKNVPRLPQPWWLRTYANTMSNTGITIKQHWWQNCHKPELEF